MPLIRLNTGAGEEIMTGCCLISSGGLGVTLDWLIVKKKSDCGPHTRGWESQEGLLHDRLLGPKPSLSECAADPADPGTTLRTNTLDQGSMSSTRSLLEMQNPRLQSTSTESEANFFECSLCCFLNITFLLG